MRSALKLAYPAQRRSASSLLLHWTKEDTVSRQSVTRITDYNTSYHELDYLYTVVEHVSPCEETFILILKNLNLPLDWNIGGVT